MPGGGVRLSVGRGWRVTPTPLGILSGGVNPGRWGERASLGERAHPAQLQHSSSSSSTQQTNKTENSQQQTVSRLPVLID